MRFALWVDDDLSDFYRRFRRDPLIGPLIRRMPDFRPQAAAVALGGAGRAVVGQLIEAERAALIQRRIVGRWGARLGEGRGALRDVPGPAAIAGRAPAELEAMELARRTGRWRCGGWPASRRRAAAGLGSPAGTSACWRSPQIGPWTVQCLGLFGRSELDSLPAGDLGYVKLVGRLAGLGRRATVAEVEEFYAPYEPYRGLVGALTLAGLHRRVAQGPPLRLAA